MGWYLGHQSHPISLTRCSKQLMSSEKVTFLRKFSCYSPDLLGERLEGKFFGGEVLWRKCMLKRKKLFRGSFLKRKRVLTSDQLLIYLAL